ncbi:MAG: hypothetical protein KAI29_17115, partial [Cyclobacteriaceae bacterium]|nr:hypothetical protein [Cyclobacteriaceae bacterium]
MKFSKFKAILFLIPIFFVTCEPKTELEQELALQKQNFLVWKFPLPRTHTGALIGNGVQGLMIWGVDNQLNITIGRAGFWDRRGGKDFLKNTTYKQVKNFLYSKNEKGLRKAFGMDEKTEPGQPARPHQIGGGRLEIELPEGWKLERGVLDLNYGIFEVTARNAAGEFEIIRIRQSVYGEGAAVTLSSKINDKVKVRLIPSWEHVKDMLEPVGIEPPEKWSDE